MPLIDKYIIKRTGVLGIWEIQESDDYYRDNLHLFPQEEYELSQLSSRKRTEWLASRYLLHALSGKLDRTPCLKDEYGKPYLYDSEYHISMSHSHDRVAVIASDDLCGIDIQIMVEKITRIARKFCTVEELAFIKPENRLKYLHFIWGAKECMYKAYGKRGIDMRKNMRVDSFIIPKKNQIITTGQLTLPEQSFKFTIHGKINDEFVLVYALDVSDHDHDGKL
jgi:phosphopantetheinyl transferase